MLRFVGVFGEAVKLKAVEEISVHKEEKETAKPGSVHPFVSRSVQPFENVPGGFECTSAEKLVTFGSVSPPPFNHCTFVLKKTRVEGRLGGSVG